MEKRIITFKASGQSLQRVGGITTAASDTVNYFEAHFELDENWQSLDSVRAIWSNEDTAVPSVIANGICTVPTEVLTNVSKLKVNLVGSITDNGIVTERLTTFTCPAFGITVKVPIDGTEPQEVTPTQFEQFVEIVKADADRAEQAVSDSREQADRSETEADRAKSEADRAEDEANNALASAQNAHASELRASGYASDAQQSAESAQGYAQNASESATSAENAKDDAEDARDVILGMRAVATILPEGSEPTARFENGILYLGIPKGDTGEKGNKGDTGNGISSITKTGTSGLVDTYTITYTNGQTTTFTVTNGAKGDTGDGIASIEKTSAVGLLDTYTITYTNGTTTTFTVTNGEKGDKGDTGEVSLEQLSELLPTDTASGAIASFPDGQSVIPALSVLCDIDPIQDLHGYDKPWVGGAGKNKLSNNYYEKSVTSRNGITYTVNDDGSVTLQGTSTVQGVSNWEMILSGSPSGLKAGTYIISADGLQSGVQIIFGGNVSSIPYNTVTYLNTSRQFTLSSDDDTLGYCLIQVNGGATINTTIFPMIRLASETDATYEPYQNICPISGHTECVTDVCGVNMWDEEWELGTYDIINGQKSASNNHIRCKTPVSVVPNTEYHFNTNGYNINVCYMDKNMGFISNFNSVADVMRTTPQNCHYIVFNLAMAYGTTYNHDISINYPSTDHDYHAYNGTTHTTSLGRTVYGGEVEVVGGSLTDKMGMVDLGSLNYSRQAGDDGVYVFTTAGLSSKAKGVTNIISDVLATTNITAWGTDKPNNSICGSASSTTVVIRADAYSDATSLKSFLSGHYACYELATPQTYQLTPTEVTLLKGQNNVWTDSGEVEVTYKADVQRWVNKKINALI